MLVYKQGGAGLGPENPLGQYYLTPGTFYYWRMRTQSLNLERKRLFSRDLGQARTLYFLCRTGQINWRKKLWDSLLAADILKPVARDGKKAAAELERNIEHMLCCIQIRFLRVV